MHYCEVPGCSNHSGMPDITVYMFPSETANPERHLIWKRKVGITKPITSDVRICNMHFQKNDFYQHKRNTTSNKVHVPLLKPTAIPNRNLPGQCYEEDVSESEPSEEELLKKRKLENDSEIVFEMTKYEPVSIDPIANMLQAGDSAISSTKTFMQKYFSDYWDAKQKAKVFYIELETNKKSSKGYEIIIPDQPLSVPEPELTRMNSAELPSNNEYTEPINILVTDDENTSKVKFASNIIENPPDYINNISNKLSDMKDLINTRMDKLEAEIAELRNINLLAQQFPFDNLTDLLDFESKLKSTPDLLQSFHHYLNSIPGTETGELYLAKILNKLFSSDLRKTVFWDSNSAKISGRINRPTSKVVINNFKLINLIRSTVLQQFNDHVNYNGLEDEFKNFFCH